MRLIVRPWTLYINGIYPIHVSPCCPLSMSIGLGLSTVETAQLMSPGTARLLASGQSLFSTFAACNTCTTVRVVALHCPALFSSSSHAVVLPSMPIMLISDTRLRKSSPPLRMPTMINPSLWPVCRVEGVCVCDPGDSNTILRLLQARRRVLQRICKMQWKLVPARQLQKR